MTPPRIWIFGCFGDCGHHIHDCNGYPDTGAVPYDVNRACDAIRAGGDRKHQIEGGSVPRSAPVPEGWSFVSWWDRQGDQRHGSHTGVLARGAYTAEELVDAARRLAPWAIRVDVKV